MKVDLPQDAEHRKRTLVSSGNYGALRQALEEGERSGIAEDYSLEGLLAELDAEPE
jgi:Bacterial antitoxin of ParD toxin-antitoxin type II system and RHH